MTGVQIIGSFLLRDVPDSHLTKYQTSGEETLNIWQPTSTNLKHQQKLKTR